MSGAVTASTQQAADAGAEILRAGGNAIDAAVAAALATCVADPCNVGIGGYGGYLVVHDPHPGPLRSDTVVPAGARGRGGIAKCVQFPLWAPTGMKPESLARPYPEEGPECSSVPNVVGGLARALAELGSLPWERVSEPASRLARDGVEANACTRRAFEQNRQRGFMAECFEIDATADRFVFRQPALAATLERMAEQGPGWFYSGALGPAACRAWKAAGVTVPLDDWWRQAEVVEVLDAARHDAAGHRLFAPTLGLSGSACVFATFTAAARIGAARLREADGLAELAAAMARVWQYRFAAGAGNDFSGVDLGRWIDTALEGHGEPAQPAREAAHTAHVNAADATGRMVALTATHGPAWFGGRWVIPGTGVVMNGGMHNFTRPSVVRRNGRWLGVSNMSPTIALGDSGERVAVGCPGARRIPSNIGLVLARHLVAGEPLQAAVGAGRFHAEEAHRVTYEGARTSAQLLAALRARFEAVEPEPEDIYFGPLSAIRMAASGEAEAATDDRSARGYSAITRETT